MKTRSLIIGGLLVTLVSFQVTAQQVENDDMYFNSKDREKLKSVSAESSFSTHQTTSPKKKVVQEPIVEENVNPTDSYSARNINPEYISRSNSTQASADEQNYYVAGYTAPNASNSNSNAASYYNTLPTTAYSNNNLNYQNNLYGSSMYNPLYSPYGGYGNSWMNPYYSSSPGWTLSLSYFWGNTWGSGMNYGMNYGMGYGYGSAYNPYSCYPSYGYPGNYYYSGTSAHEKSTRNYAKRPSIGSPFVTPIKKTTVTNTTTVAGNSGSRVRQDEYYVKPSRRMSSYGNSTSGNSYDPFSNSRISSGSSSGSRTNYTSPSRSSSYSSPSRSSSFSAPSHSGGSVRPRGRN